MLQTFHKVHKLLDLVNDDGVIDGSVPRAYYNAFQIAITHGDIARKKTFVERAASTRTILEGNDNLMIQRIKSLALNPIQHMSHSLSQT